MGKTPKLDFAVEAERLGISLDAYLKVLFLGKTADYIGQLNLSDIYRTFIGHLSDI